MAEISVVSRSGKSLGKFNVTAQTTVADFKTLFAKQNSKYYPSRQWFTYDKDGSESVKVNDSDKKLIQDYGLKTGATLVFKDLGPQVSWTTVFLTEYFGPIVIHALMYFVPSLFYSQPVTERHIVQKIGFACVILHYVKRELETVFVHRFSNDTMPLMNIFKNSFHYWVLSGALIAYFLYHPLYTASLPMPVVYFFVGVFIIAEFGNLHAHLILKNLRPPGTKVRAIPRGQLFELVSCANYTWELLAWLAFACLSQTLTSFVFFAVSAGQIWLWSVKKHRRYLQEFDDYPRRRKILVPYLA